MSIDKVYLRKILSALDQSPSHEMMSADIATHLGFDFRKPAKNELEKFIQHILYLGDENLIDCPKIDFGFSKNLNGDWSYYTIRYRITSRGLAYLTELNRVVRLGPFVTWLLSILEEAVRKPLVALIQLAIFALLLSVANYVYQISNANSSPIKPSQNEVAR